MEIHYCRSTIADHYCRSVKNASRNLYSETYTPASNKIEKIPELNRWTVYFYSPKHLEVEILQISRVHDLYK